MQAVSLGEHFWWYVMLIIALIAVPLFALKAILMDSDDGSSYDD